MPRQIPALASFILLAACAAGPTDDYERHSSSRLVAVEGARDEYVFEVQEAAGGAAADAEAVRMRWLSQWLELRGVCAAGYEIVDRRRFGSMEYNPMRADYRYLVRCRARAASEDSES